MRLLLLLLIFHIAIIPPVYAAYTDTEKGRLTRFKTLAEKVNDNFIRAGLVVRNEDHPSYLKKTAETFVGLLVLWAIDAGFKLGPQYMNAYRYGNCAICQDTNWDNVHTLKCGHHFHRSCLGGWLKVILADIEKYETWRVKIAAVVEKLPPFFANMVIISSIMQLPEEQQGIYARTLQEGKWSGAEFTCPLCRTLIN